MRTTVRIYCGAARVKQTATGGPSDWYGGKKKIIKCHSDRYYDPNAKYGIDLLQ